ncbi:MAG TPA: ABC transporter transmembrane domain-containing protein [Ktedonobacteraceae bacterium]|nr:ABC transporter transmembrane domain-containing protein [Ktedonobacteraceae bacterium]
MLVFKFLFRNLKGYRLLVVLAIFVTILQVGSDIAAAFPLKFIPSKVSNSGNDPACTFDSHFSFLNPILDKFDIPLFDPSLAPLTPGGPNQTPPIAPCPVSPSDTNPPPPVFTHHSVNGVIVFSILLLIGFGSLSAFLAYLDLYIAAYIAQNLTARLRNQLFEHLQRLSLDWHGKQKKGDLVQRITGNISDIEKLVTDGLVDLLAAVLTLAGIASVMLLLSPQYTVIALTIVPALFMITLGYTKSIKAAAKKAAKATGQVSDVATEDINALTVIKVFTREEKEALRFGEHVDKNRRAGLRAGGLAAQFAPIVSLLVILGTAAVLGVGGIVANNNNFSLGFITIPALSVDIGTLILFLTFLKLLYQPIRDLSKLATLFSTAGSGAERIQEVLDQAPEVLESQVPYNGPTKLRGDIRFENVVFGYNREQAVLKGMNLHIPAGKKVALVGLSGGGKTTLVKLIPRFYEIQQGAVKVDGVDNRAYPLTVLRQNVSMVLQDSVLFEGTVAENIAIGKPGAPLYEVIEAAKKANIHETIIKDLGGYDGEIREQGKNLSGGQRQRMAIARAILRDAPILILDEPTAALDVESEAEVLHALEKLIVGRTVIMISHRLSTLGNVEEIIVLKNGQIAEQGTFQELKRRGGVFAGLLNEQNRYNLEKAAEQSMVRSAFVPLEIYDQRYVQQAPVQPPRPPVIPASPVPPPAGQNWPLPVSPVVQPSQPVYPKGRPDGNGRQQPQRVAVPVAPQRARVLIEVDGKVIGERALNKPFLTVGRLSSNDVQVPSQRVSRLHAKIHEENGTWVIEDAESLNGLIYRGQRVDRLVLNNGDRIHVSPTAVLQFVTS